MPVRFPCMSVKLVPAGLVKANDYNPNRVAPPEMDLLRQSIEADGVTQPIVVYRDDEGMYVVVDGFHRYTLLSGHFGCTEIPVVEIDRDLRDRMASTIRHNRARGKHQVDLMGEIVRNLIALGWSDEMIAGRLGMSADELLRLKQIVGVAHLLAASEYSLSWGENEANLSDD